MEGKEGAVTIEEFIKVIKKNMPRFEQTGQEMVPPPERVSSPEEDYETADVLFLSENLDQNFESVERQPGDIRDLIEKYNKANKELKEDPDMEQYVEEYSGKITKALENFEINGKAIDLTKLTKSTNYNEIYNDVVYEVNQYIDSQMIGQNKQPIQQI